MKSTIRPSFLFFLSPLLYVVLIVPSILVVIFSGHLVISIIFTILALFMFSLFWCQLKDRLRVKIEVSDEKIILPVLNEMPRFPGDLDGELVPLDGFEFDGDKLVGIVFLDREGKYTIPFENLVGVWEEIEFSGFLFAVFGTDYYDIEIPFRLFGKKRLREFIDANIPKALRTENVRFNSVPYQTDKKYFSMLRDEKEKETTLLKNNKGWLIPFFSTLLAIVFIIWELLTDTFVINVCYTPFTIFLLIVCGVSFFQIYGERELTVDLEKVEFRIRGQKYRMDWKDVKYITFQWNLILWGDDKRLVIPKEFVKLNKFLLYMMKIKRYERDFFAKHIIFDEWIWNKNTKI